MSTTQAKTLQERFGFVDADLKTPKHDEIVIWLDEHMDTLIPNLMPHLNEWPEKWINECFRDIKRAVEGRADGDAILASMPPMPPSPPSIAGSTWEKPVMNNKFMVGFIDIQTAVFTPSIGVGGLEWTSYGSPRYINKPLFWNIAPPYKMVGSEAFILNFEAKSTIPSLGELIRQVRMYEEFVKGKFYVVSPDTRFAKQITGQGIGFIKYPTMEIL